MPLLKHLEDLRTTADVLGQLSVNLKNYPGNEYASKVRSALAVASFITTDYALRCSHGQEPFDALGETLAAMESETGIEAVELVHR
jgi:hypothetical protein